MHVRSRGLRLLLLALVAAISALALWQARTIRFDTSLEAWFVEDDVDLAAYREFLDVFASDQIVLIAWEEPALWTPDGMAALRRYTEEIAALTDVRDARSLATSSEVLASPGSLVVTPLWDPDAPKDLAALKARVLADDLYTGTLTSRDGRIAAIVVTVEHRLQDSTYKIALAERMRTVADRIGAERGAHVALAGPPLLDDAFFRFTRRDLTIIFPLMGLVIVGTVLLLFGSARALLLPAAVVGLSTLWVAGLMGTFGVGVTVIHNIIFPLILGLGIASSIHVTSRVVLLRGEGASAEDASYGALGDLLAPCIWTTLTTIGGLLSLWTGTLKPIREFGALSAAGALAALALTWMLGPTLLPLLGPPRAARDGRAAGLLGALDRLLVRVGLLAEHRPGRVLAFSAALLAVALAAMPTLQLGGNVLEYFHEDARVRTDVEFVDAHLAGTTTLEVFVRTGRTDGLKEPAVLAAMAGVQAWMETIDGVGATLSLADFVSELRRVQRGGAEAEARVPETRAEVSQLLLMLDDPAELERLADFDFARGRITATVQLSKVTTLTSHIPELEDRLRSAFAPLGAQASATGQSRLIFNMETYLLHTMISSLATAFVLVSVFMAFALRSATLGLFSMIPNVLPIGLALGFMAWTGIRLDPGTATTGAVALGLVVDDTLHFLHQFRRWTREGYGLAEATERTLRHSGRAIVMTSVILTAAFGSMLVASFTPNNNFGLLSALTIALALVADLVVLPASLAFVKPKLGRT